MMMPLQMKKNLMSLIYGECRKNRRKALNVCKRRYPDRRMQSALHA